MERRPRVDAPRAAPTSAALALSLAAALVLGTGEARAAAVCSSTPGAGDTISCTVVIGSTTSIDIDARNLAISTADDNGRGVYAQHRGLSGDIDLDLTGGSVAATGNRAAGVRGSQIRGSGEIFITTKDLSVTAGGATGSGSIRSVFAEHFGSGSIDLDLTGGSVAATGRGSAHGVVGHHDGASGDIDLRLTGGSVTATGGQYVYGLHGRHSGILRRDGSGTISIATENAAVTATGGWRAYGVLGYHAGASGDIDLDLTGGSVTATATRRAYGVYGVGSSSGGISITTENLAVTATGGQEAYGVYGYHFGASGDVDLDLTGGSITAAGDSAFGIHGINEGPGGVSITARNLAVTAEGLTAYGVNGFHLGPGSVTITTDAEVKIQAPFSVGVRGILTSDANAAGRVVIDSGGATEAREVGVSAWAARSSGHTFGEGAQTADDASRTEPMIHVTSSGDVTAGSSVTDAFIRAALAGEDETLSAGEKAVYDAIVAADSDALGTALMALPMSYDAAWKARANALSDRRGHEPTDAGVLANRAAEEILGLTRSGIRALALSHEAIAGHVRNGDGDGALSAAERTALAAALTGGDLETALAALSATYTDAWKDTLREMAASYNAGDVRVDVTGGTITAEGDGVDARYALTHDRNGAIAVSVAEGASVSGGRHGIHVRGAGLVEGNADLRDQTVTVNGAVTGGTGAGVHLAGGGTVTVGRTGRIGATSGVGILSEGTGDLVATVAGTVEGDVRAMGGGDLSATVTGTGTVEGNLRTEGGGALTVDVQEGGTVTGTVHDPVGPLTLHGSIGRLLYVNGGTVTVAPTGRLTGVDGETAAIQSEAGDLAVTVAGTVQGDVRAMGGGYLDATISGTVAGDLLAQGGALTVDVQEGGAVTGTVHTRGLRKMGGFCVRKILRNSRQIPGIPVSRRPESCGIERKLAELKSEGRSVHSDSGERAGTATATVRSRGPQALRAVSEIS